MKNTDAIDLIHKWTQALLAERDEERSRLQLLLQDTSLKSRRAEGVTWSPVSVVRAEYAFGGAKWSLECGSGGGTEGAFRAGSAVLLTPIGSHAEVQEWGTWPARVVKMRGLAMEVLLEGEGPEGVAIQHLKWTVDARADERSFQAMAHALNHWLNTEDPELRRYRDLGLGLPGALPAQGDPSGEVGHDHSDSWTVMPVTDPSLNQQQANAVRLITSGGPVTLVHGPPGTGKTRTLVAAIQNLVDGGCKVLAAAPSNMAVDVLVERLSLNGLEVVRMGHPMRVQEHVLNRTLDALVEGDSDHGQVVALRRRAAQVQREADRYVRNFGPEERKARQLARSEARSLRRDADDMEGYLADRWLARAQVVCATLVGCDDTRLRDLKFDVVVVDEASQALPPATLIAMRRAPRLVLCGDPCQLPPTVKSQGGKVLEQTMLERGLLNAIPAVMLEVQHRMHADIMSAGNEHFYGGSLRAHPSVSDRKLDGLPPWLWVDTAGCGFNEDKLSESGSVRNVEEADFVVARASEWLDLHPGMTLGIVAPYAAQVECLTSSWQRAVQEGRVSGASEVTIHTVDGFQGQERDGMLVSLTRSNSEGRIGFLAESRRIHVAQTRARMACMLVGDSATLCQDPYLAWLVEWAQHHGCYDSAWSWLT
ncbi:MAG: AAA domain-containing protein [Bacteroidetes bacterium]|nr:AAA domain-containing protein [Bacteroidota bacterium]